MSYWYDQLVAGGVGGGGVGGVVPSVLIFWLSQVFNEVLIRITSNLLHRFIVTYLSICAWFPVDIFYDFLYFWVFFFQCFYLEKSGLKKNVKVSD